MVGSNYEDDDETLILKDTNSTNFSDALKPNIVPKGSIISSTFNLSNSAIGAGVLAFPFAFSRCGLLLGILISVVQVLICGVALHWIAKESQKQDHTTFAHSYDQLVTNKLGNVAGGLCILAIMGNIFGAMVGFLIIIGDMVEPLSQNFLNTTEWYGSREFLSLVLAILLVFPLSSLPRIDSLSFTSSISIISITFVVMMVVYNSIVTLIEGTAVTGDIKLFIFDLSVFEAIPIITFALTCHVQVPPIYQEFKDHSVPRFRFVIIATFSICFVLYVSCGSFGYAEFKEYTDDNILSNYPSSDALPNIARICVIITALFSYPVMSFVFRQTIDFLFFTFSYNVFFKKQSPISSPPYIRLFVESTISLALAWILSVLFPSIGTVFGLIGATGGSLIVFVFPPLLELKETESKPYKAALITVIVIGVIVGTLSSAVIIVDIINTFSS